MATSLLQSESGSELPATRRGIVWVDFDPRRKDHSLSSNFEDYFHIIPSFCNDIEVGVPDCNDIASVIFELDYPDIDSLQRINRFRHQKPDIPVILISVEHSEEFVLWALRNHIWSFYYKPLSNEDIADIYFNIDRLSKSISSKSLKQASIPLSNARACDVNIRSDRMRYEKRIVDIALNYIEAKLAEKISVADVAKQCGVTYFRFREIFQKEMSKTLQEYLIELRIERAKQLLRKLDSNIASISYEVGFQDPSYFTRVFTRISGTSPSKYRSTCRKDVT